MVWQDAALGVVGVIHDRMLPSAKRLTTPLLQFCSAAEWR